MTSYEVAIPSHGRADIINRGSLRLLADRGVPADRVTVWVAPDEVDTYRAAVDRGLCRAVEPSALGLVANRNAYLATYERTHPAGLPLLNLDDDIDDVVEALDPKTKVPVDDLDDLARSLVSACVRFGCRLGGVGAVPNPFYMRPDPTVTLKYCPSGFVLYRLGPAGSNGPLFLDERWELMEDRARVAQVWRADGRLYRENRYAIVTRYWANPGGQTGSRSPVRMAVAARTMATEWPDLFRVRNKGHGRFDVAFKPQRGPR